MTQRWIALALLTCLTTAGFAATCPTVAAIKQQKATGWLAYDSDDGSLLPEKRSRQIRRGISEFALAEWNEKSNSIHCYYRDRNGSDLDAYFAKSHLMPAKTNRYWYTVSGLMQCAAGEQACEFVTGRA